jgi:hypothetical protein
MLIPERYRLVVLIAGSSVCLCLAGLQSGCAIGSSTNGDGTADMLGLVLDGGTASQAASIGGTIGGLLFGPPGAAAGTALAGAIFGLWRGQRQGWDERGREVVGPALAVAPVPASGGGVSDPSPSQAAGVTA